LRAGESKDCARVRRAPGAALTRVERPMRAAASRTRRGRRTRLPGKTCGGRAGGRGRDERGAIAPRRGRPTMHEGDRPLDRVMTPAQYRAGRDGVVRAHSTARERVKGAP